MPHHFHLFPDLLMLVLGLAALMADAVWLLERPGWQTVGRSAAVWATALVVAGIEVGGYLFSFHRFWGRVPPATGAWIGASGLILIALGFGLFLGLLAWRISPPHQTPRRRFLQTAGLAAVASPVLGISFGILERNRFELVEVKVPIPNLPKDLEGLRLVQVTDIHLSPFLSEREFARAIDMANEAKAHVMLVTGDLITRMGDPLDACLRQLARLRGEAGVLGCLGNHEIHTRSEDYVTQQGKRIGIEFLRMQARSLRFGSAAINFAGVDYQSFDWPYLIDTEKLIQPGQVNVMLSHNPDVFPVAAKKGYQLTIAGHTHGGQVNVEILRHNFNVARTFTPYIRGLYQKDGSSIYVSSGIGTIGVPVRVGAPPEISLITLCAS